MVASAAMSVALAILSLGALVLLHEAGHFLVARACRMRVEVFSLGFGPSLFCYRGRLTEYRLSLVPLGGYVRIAGMAPGDFPPDDPASFQARPWWQRVLVLLAGPVSNWLFAFLLLAALYLVGFRIPSGEPVIEEVRGKTAMAAGLYEGDRVLAVDGKPVSTWSELTQAQAQKSGEVEIKVRRSEVERIFKARSGAAVAKEIIAESSVVRLPVGEAISQAFFNTLKVAGGMLVTLREWIFGKGEGKLIGPVGVVGEAVEAARTGFDSLLAMLVFISIALSLMNLLPLPALDGGRVAFVEAVVHALGVLALLVLVVALSWREIGALLPGSREASSPPVAAGSPDASLPAPR